MSRRGMSRLITLKMSKIMVDVVEAIAAAEGRTRSDIIREAVACYVSRKARENPEIMERLLGGMGLVYAVAGDYLGGAPRPGVRRVRV